MIAWTTVEDAIQLWVRTAAGVSSDRVMWAQQNNPRPVAPFVTLRVTRMRRIGQDWIDVEDNPTPTPGNEIIHRARGVREMQVSLQCIGGQGFGTSAPIAILENVISYLRLPTVHDALVAAGVGVARFSQVISIDGVVGSTLFEPRATLDFFAFLAEEVEETGTFIEFVELNRDPDLPPGSFFVPEEP